jgi:hypothetical protein
MGLPEQAQFPLNMVGPKGQHAFIGSAKMFFNGATGLVSGPTSAGTFYGIPGISATRRATGVYPIKFPAVKELTIIPGVQAPTGQPYQVNISQINPTSGTAIIEVTRMEARTVPTGSVASMYAAPHNPVSGTVVNLMFIASPVAAY